MRVKDAVGDTKMAKMKIKDAAAKLLEGFLTENALELFNVEYVKEGRSKYLRVYIDKPEGSEEEYVSIEECEKVSRYLSDRLDEEDFIDENYILEVSSPGMDRPLLRDSDYKRYAGRIVDINLYKAIDGKKLITGELVGLKEGNVEVVGEDGEIISVPKEQISKTRLAVIF